MYDGEDLSIEAPGDDQYRLYVDGTEQELNTDEIQDELRDRTDYVPSMDDIVDSMEEFEVAKQAGQGAISMERTTTLVVGTWRLK